MLYVYYMINPNPAKIEELFSLSAKYEVPKYQRQYTWGKSEALEFLDDLKSFANENSQGALFLGTVIFDISEINTSIIKIVDGQQRITTMLILLIACKQVAKNINSVSFAQEIQNKITFISRTGESVGPRLVTSESIKDIFTYISSSEWDGVFIDRLNNKSIKRQVNKIKPIYDFFFKEIQNLNHSQLEKFINTIYDSYVVRIDIENEMEAFSIFERTNARGVDLEASDLLKNYLFQSGIDGLDEIWSQIIENSDGTVLRMLKYFYVSKKGYVSKSNLYKGIKNYSNEIGPNKLVCEIDEFSKFYSIIRTGELAEFQEYLNILGFSLLSQDQEKIQKLFSSVEALRLFKVTQIYPLIYSALKSFIRNDHNNNIDSKKFISFFDKLEKYHFINNAICERVGNEVEKLYADYCRIFSETNNFIETLNELTTSLSEKIAQKDEFISRFTDISYSSDSIALISYIFDRLNNYNVSPASWVKIFNPSERITRRSHNIEHFYPQNPTGVVNSDISDHIDNIGNLIVISFRTNSSLGNLLPNEKIKKLENELFQQIQNLDYVRKFIDEYKVYSNNWDKNIISNRASALAIESYNNVWKF